MSNNIHFSCICGIDIAKKVMQVFKVTSDGVVTNTSVSRKDFLEHFRNIPPALIGMEACATSQHFAWDPVWFGVMMTVNLAVGQVTPPVAVNLYVSAQIADLTMEEMTPPVIPLLLATLVALAVIVLFPGLSTFLPTLWGL